VASSLTDVLILLFVGVLSALAFYFYLRALNIEESSVVVPLLQLIPIFAYFLSYLILGETLTRLQIMAAAIVIIGIAILSLEFDIDNKIKLKRKVLYLVAGSSFLFALHDTLFKAVALEGNFTTSIFWQYAGLTLVGIFVFIFSPTYRLQFFNMFKHNKKLGISLNIGSEVLYAVGNIVNNFATLLAPVALVLVVSSSQPLFVFIGGTILTLFLPSIATERILLKNLIQKLLSISIILIGSYLLYTSAS
jgi:drug/metabolite transporter (DMT)-like permease